MRVLLSTVVLHGHVFVATSSSSPLLVYLFILLVGSGPTHEIVVSAFSRSPLGRVQTRFHSNIFGGRGGGGVET